MSYKSNQEDAIKVHVNEGLSKLQKQTAVEDTREEVSREINSRASIEGSNTHMKAKLARAIPMSTRKMA